MINIVFWDMSHIFVQREIETSKVFSILSAVLKRYLFRRYYIWHQEGENPDKITVFSSDS